MKKLTAQAHCDGPCGIYDPAAARIAAEAALSMTRKILDLVPPALDQPQAFQQYLNTLGRYVRIKEDQAQVAKTEILILWTDYFKPEHLEKYPQLHQLFWETAKLCSSVKGEVNLDHAQELLEKIQEIHQIFWDSKGREVPWILAG